MQPELDNPPPPQTPPMDTGQADQTQTQFVHEAEATFARILDFYRIAWEYEPRTFPLEWDESGNVVEAFAPDFYLPDQKLFIELTTLRPQLTTRKNRKLRRMKELYPKINIKLFKRSDLRTLMVKYGMDQEAEKITGTGAQTEAM